MNNTQALSIQSLKEASAPKLIKIEEVVSTFPKSKFAVYYNIPLTFDYHNINFLKGKEYFLPSNQITFKIINFQTQTDPVYIKATDIKIIKNDFSLTCQNSQGKIKIEGKIINQAKQSSVVADISLSDIKKYAEFYQFRKKFITLENLTRKIEFSIDHRIKFTTNNQKEFYFSMDQLKDNQDKHWYLNWNEKTQVTVFLEEIVSVGQVNSVKIVQQGTFSFRQLNKGKSYSIIFKPGQYLQIQFSLNTIKNADFSQYQFVSLRVLQTSQKGQSLKIGTEQNIFSQNTIKISPILQNKFYDMQYGYLSKNLKSLGQTDKSSVLQHLDKLTKSFPNYPHFINQKLMDLTDCRQLIFEINSKQITIPIVYLFHGYNVFHNQFFQIKFFLQTQTVEKRQIKQKPEKSIKDKSLKSYRQGNDLMVEKVKNCFHKKLFQLKITNLINVGDLINLADQMTISVFFIKIKCENILYAIKFQCQIVDSSQFKKQAKQLQLRTEYSQFVDGQFMLIRKIKSQVNKLLLIKSKNIQPFYLLELTDSTPVYFEGLIQNKIVMYGSLSKKYFFEMQSQNQSIFSKNIVLNSLDNTKKIVLNCSFASIIQRNQSFKSNFKFKYMIFVDEQVLENVHYDIQILRISSQEIQAKKRKRGDRLHAKIQPVFSVGQGQNTILKQFTDRSFFLQGNKTLQIQLKARKMYYNQNMNYFDNQILINKQIIFNREAQSIITQNTLIIDLPQDSTRVLQFQAYDQNIKKKIKLRLQVFCKKSPFYQGNQHVLKIKIPPLLWTINKSFLPYPDIQPSIEIQSHLNSKNNKGNKLSIFYNSFQEYTLPHYNYNDGLSIRIDWDGERQGESQYGYGKVQQIAKAKGQIVGNNIGFIDESQWYLGVFTLKNSNFYMLMKLQFDSRVQKQRQSSNESAKTQKNLSKGKNSKVGHKKQDLMMKTVKNMDLFRLKKIKNDLALENRKLTTQFVQKQQNISKLNKKIVQIDQTLRKKKQQQSEATQNSSSGTKPSKKMKQFYRSICECGYKNPPFNGYCGQCLQKMRKKYELYSKQYHQKAGEYQKIMFDKYNIKQKIVKIKNRITNYKNIINGSADPIVDQNNFNEMFTNIEQKQLKFQIQQLKLQNFNLQEQKKSQLDRRAWQMQKLEQKIKKQDRQIWQGSQQLSKLRNKLAEMKALIQLDKQSTII